MLRELNQSTYSAPKSRPRKFRTFEKVLFSPHSSSPCTRTTAHPKTTLLSSWSFQMTPHWPASSKDGGKSAYRQEVKELAVWCSLNKLVLNMLKTVEMIMYFRRNPPLTIRNSTVTAVESFRFLGTTISQDLKWDNHIDSIVKKAQQRPWHPSPSEEVQSAIGVAEKVLLCHHWIRQ